VSRLICHRGQIIGEGLKGTPSVTCSVSTTGPGTRRGEAENQNRDGHIADHAASSGVVVYGLLGRRTQDLENGEMEEGCVVEAKKSGPRLPKKTSAAWRPLFQGKLRQRREG